MYFQNARKRKKGGKRREKKILKIETLKVKKEKGNFSKIQNLKREKNNFYSRARSHAY